jgi:hypothetical protein
MQTEWYFFDANGYTVGGDRFYINFLFQARSRRVITIGSRHPRI